MEKTNQTVENDLNCNKLKNEYYKCLKNEDKNIGEEMKLFAKNKLNKIKDYKIDQKILKKCGNEKLLFCLNKKYRMENIDDQELIEAFSNQYDRIMKIKTKMDK